LNSVLSVTSAKQCWEKLSAHYKGQGEQCIIHLINKVFRSTFSDTEPLKPQINALVRAARTITTLGLALEDKLIAFTIISSLPTTLTTLKIILSTSNMSSLFSEYVKSQIILDEQCRIHDSGIGATAFFAKVAKKGKGKKKPEGRANKKCTHCNFQGHDVSECCKLKKEQETKSSATLKPGQSTATANVAVVDTAPSDTTIQLFTAHAKGSPEAAYLFSTCTELPPSFDDVVHALRSHPTPALKLDLLQHWIIDSGASRTMCCHRDWFFHFTPLTSPIPVVLGDDSSIVASGVGHIHVKMHADGSKHHSVLRDVLYVPDLQGNLLSVAQLAHHGAKVQFADHRCELINSHGILTCTGHVHGTLYLMDMHTVCYDPLERTPFFSFSFTLT
jgi:gag-polypeptide of LTR copia-type